MSGLRRKKRTRRRKREIPHSPSATNTRRRRLAYSRARCIKEPISETSLKRTYLSATTVPVGPPHLRAFQYRMTRSGTVVLRTKDGYGRGAAGWSVRDGRARAIADCCRVILQCTLRYAEATRFGVTRFRLLLDCRSPIANFPSLENFCK